MIYGWLFSIALILSFNKYDEVDCFDFFIFLHSGEKFYWYIGGIAVLLQKVMKLVFQGEIATMKNVITTELQVISGRDEIVVFLTTKRTKDMKTIKR